MTDTLQFHVDPFGETRWRVRVGNGEPTLASTEGYVHPRDARENAARYLLLEPTDDDARFIVHTTDEVLALVQRLEDLTAQHSAAYMLTEIRQVASEIRRLLQIPGGAR